MAASENYHVFSPIADTYHYNMGLTSSYHHHHLHQEEAHMVPFFGYFQPGLFLHSPFSVPLYPHYQPWPSDFELSHIHHMINCLASFSGRAESEGYHQFMDFDYSPQEVYMQPQPYRQEGFSGRAAYENRNQLTGPSASFSGRGVNGNYSSMVSEGSLILDAREVEEKGDEGLCEEIISKNLKLKDDQCTEDDDPNKICVVCQDCLLRDHDKIAGLDCGHDFHARCIAKWLMRKNSCPLCKATGIKL
ncbi:RING/U-box superfamily protein [Striga asiatica]|uniref:RING-type E3 ubiquitin transferase n=1 Tax=Striga asiatica TaxID=4170 RepID=A0A5A7QS57_STRAF|nr:RING/U-box superfamily protein [Striga asiatica]